MTGEQTPDEFVGAVGVVDNRLALVSADPVRIEAFRRDYPDRQEIDAAGKSLRYQTIKLTKYDQHDWKNYTKTFKLSPKTDAIALHITADYLDGEDSFRFANLKLTMQPAGK